MIGNDIVDIQLAHIQSNWQRRGWMQKIYTPKEQNLILKSTNPEREVWILWTMKEATYKAHQRRFGLQPKYNPKSFECDTMQKSVIIDDFEYEINTSITNEYIYSVAFLSNINYTSEVFTGKYEAKKRVKELLNHKSVKALQIHMDKDTNGIPILKNNHTRIDIPFSLTHHGKFSAFAILQ